MPEFLPADLAVWSGGEWRAAASIPTLNGISHDTRQMAPGTLFVAVAGDRFDGHDFLQQAFAAGASAAMVRRGHPAVAGVSEPLLQVDCTRRALAAVATGHRRKIGCTVVGITGSAGKTTVKEMTARMLDTAMPTVRTRGNWNNDIGVPLSLLAMERSTRVGVFEIASNHPGEIDALAQVVEPDWGVVTNVGPVHIGHFGSLAAIAAEKGALLRHVPLAGRAFLCRDGQFFDDLAGLTRAAVTTVSMRQDADYRCVDTAVLEEGGTRVTILERATGARATLDVAIPGAHNVSNAMLALAVARAFGVAWDEIGRALREYKTMPMRWERDKVGGVTVINDAYNANPLSMRAALTTFGDLIHGGRKWLVLAGMLELGNESEREHVDLGRFVARSPWAGLIVVGDLAEGIAAGAEDAGMSAQAVVRTADTDAAVEALAARVRAGDAVLFKASRGLHLEFVIAGWRKRQPVD